MIKTHRIEVLCTPDEHERIINNAKTKGFSTVSAFFRDFGLKNPLTSEERIAEIHSAIVRSKLGLERIADSLLANYDPNSFYMQYPIKTEYVIHLNQGDNSLPKQNPLYKMDPLSEPGAEEHQDFDEPGY